MATSLKAVIALSEDITVDSFLDVQNNCTNESALTGDKNKLSSWESYYYYTNYTVAASLSASSVTAAGGSITVTYTIKQNASNSNGSARVISGVTPTVTSTLGTVSDITATNSSGRGTAKLSVKSRGTTIGVARTGSVTITYAGISTTLSFNQAANFMTAISIKTWNASNFTSAGGGTIDATTDVTYTSGSSHEKWDMLAISNWSCSSTGFSIAAQPSYSGQCRVTSANRGTTSGDARKCLLTVTYKNATNTNNVTLTATKEVGTQNHNNPTTATEFNVDSVSPSSKIVTAALGSFTLSWRQIKRTKYTWPSGSPDTYSDWVAETNGGITSVTSNQTWATVGTKGTSDGSGYNSITISYGANTNTSSTRSATITIKNDVNSKECTVTQNADKATDITYGTPTITAYTYATFASAGASKTPTVTYTQTKTQNYESGNAVSLGNVTSGGTLEFKMTESNGFTLGSTSTGSMTVTNNTTTSTRTPSTMPQVRVTLNGKTSNWYTCTSCTQSAGSVEYIITPSVTAMGTLYAAGTTKSATITYTTKWNGIQTATNTALSGYTITEDTDSLGIVTASGTNGTVIVTSSNNKSTSSGTFKYTISKSGYIPATISGSVAGGSYWCSITSYGTPKLSIGSGITAAGGSAPIYASVSNTQTCYWNGVVESTSSVAGSVNLSIKSQYFSTSSSATSGTAITRYSISGTTLSHSSMEKNTGYDYYIVEAVNANDSSKAVAFTTRVQNSYNENTVYSISCPSTTIKSTFLYAYMYPVVTKATKTT